MQIHEVKVLFYYSILCHVQCLRCRREEVKAELGLDYLRPLPVSLYTAVCVSVCVCWCVHSPATEGSYSSTPSEAQTSCRQILYQTEHFIWSGEARHGSMSCLITFTYLCYIFDKTIIQKTRWFSDLKKKKKRDVRFKTKKLTDITRKLPLFNTYIQRWGIFY